MQNQTVKNISNISNFKNKFLSIISGIKNKATYFITDKINSIYVYTFYLKNRYDLMQKRKYQDLIYSRIKNTKLIKSLFLNSDIEIGLTKVYVINRKFFNITILEYNKITKDLKIYYDNIAMLYLMNNGVIIDNKGKLFIKSIDGNVYAGYLKAFIYDGLKLVLFNEFFKYEIVDKDLDDIVVEYLYRKIK